MFLAFDLVFLPFWSSAWLPSFQDRFWRGKEREWINVNMGERHDMKCPSPDLSSRTLYLCSSPVSVLYVRFPSAWLEMTLLSFFVHTFLSSSLFSQLSDCVHSLLVLMLVIMFPSLLKGSLSSIRRKGHQRMWKREEMRQKPFSQRENEWDMRTWWLWLYIFFLFRYFVLSVHIFVYFPSSVSSQ